MSDDARAPTVSDNAPSALTSPLIDLMVALRHKEAAAVRHALRRGADPNERIGPRGHPVLLSVVADKSPCWACVRAVLEAGADPNAANDRGTTALMVAALWNHPEGVALLTELGANPNAVDADGCSALMKPSPTTPAPEAVRALLARGADPNAATPDGVSALMRLAMWANSDVMHAALDAGGRVHATDARGTTVLMAAALNDGHAHAVARTLLEAGADPNVANIAGVTALMCMATWGRTEAVQLLLNADADWRPIDRPHPIGGLPGRTAEQMSSHEATTAVLRAWRERAVLGAGVGAVPEAAPSELRRM